MAPLKRLTKAETILNGFRINWITLKDTESGKLLWECRDDLSSSNKEHHAKIPKEIQSCKAITRELNFSSIEPIGRLRLEQRILYKGNIFDEIKFEFGYVIPHSTNTWNSIIEAASDPIPFHVLSGNVVVETKFFDRDLLISTSNVRIFYE